MPGGMPGAAAPAKRRIKTSVKLPMLNWVAVDQRKIKDTVFSQIDDENIHDAVDFSEFENAFKLGVSTGTMKRPAAGSEDTGRKTMDAGTMGRSKGPTSVLDMNRARNLGIATRRIGMDADAVIEAIEAMDMTKIPGEKAELLRNDFLPEPEEIKLIAARLDADQKVAPLDMMLFKLSKVPRVKAKLTIMMNLENTLDTLKNISPSADAVTVASQSLMQSKHLKKLFEVILAFGNLMNSGRRGGVWGFKLSVFDRLIDMKSADKQRNLMHFVVDTISEKMPEVSNFREDIIDLNKAAECSLAQLRGELAMVKQTMHSIKSEMDAGSENAQLKAAYEELQPLAEQADKDVGEATAMFGQVTAFYCEQATVDPTTFFSTFVRLNKTYTTAEKDNLARKRREEAIIAKAKAESEKKSIAATMVTDKEESAADEFNNLDGFATDSAPTSPVAAVKEQGGLARVGKVEDGTLDLLINEMKTSAFRRPEGKAKRETRRRMSMRGARPEPPSAYGAARPWLK
jgi:hypothetical protein